jgi:hypothetical protein
MILIITELFQSFAIRWPQLLTHWPLYSLSIEETMFHLDSSSFYLKFQSYPIFRFINEVYKVNQVFYRKTYVHFYLYSWHISRRQIANYAILFMLLQVSTTPIFLPWLLGSWISYLSANHLFLSRRRSKISDYATGYLLDSNNSCISWCSWLFAGRRRHYWRAGGSWTRSIKWTLGCSSTQDLKTHFNYFLRDIYSCSWWKNLNPEECLPLGRRSARRPFEIFSPFGLMDRCIYTSDHNCLCWHQAALKHKDQ